MADFDSGLGELADAIHDTTVRLAAGRIVPLAARIDAQGWPVGRELIGA